MVEFKNGKDRAKELLSNLPHIIPHRQVCTCTICTCIYVYIHTYVYTVLLHMYNVIYTYIHTYIQYICTMSYIHTYIHAYVLSYIRMYIHTVHLYTHTYVYTLHISCMHTVWCMCLGCREWSYSKRECELTRNLLGSPREEMLRLHQRTSGFIGHASLRMGMMNCLAWQPNR